MSMRKLAPGESPREAMLATMTEIVERLKKMDDEPFDSFDKSVIALGLATWFAWTDRINEHNMPLLSGEVEETVNAIMAAWGWDELPDVEPESGLQS